MKRAVIMSRVSSDDQATGYSLDIQIEKITESCRKENISIINVIKEDHSAKNFNRPEFKKFLQYLKANKGKVDLLLVTTWDRFSRNFVESVAMIERLKSQGVEVQAIEQPLDLAIPENLLILSVYLALPDIDNKRRSIKITEGVRAAKAEGRWLGSAPYGYISVKGDKNKSVIVPGEKGEIVQYAFKEIANGKGQAELRAELKLKGISLSKSSLSDMLRNRLYVGEVYINNLKGGYYIKGLHKPLVSQKLFDNVQDILNDNVKRKRYTSTKQLREERHLRGLLICGCCGSKMTASAPKGRRGHYDYYHCNRCRKLWIRTKEVHQNVIDIFKEIKLSKNAKSLYLILLKKVLAEKGVQKKRSKKIVEEEIHLYHKRIKNLEDDLADRKIDGENFNKAMLRYRNEVIKLDKELKDQSEYQLEYSKYLKRAIDLVNNLPEFYKKSSIEIKRKLFGSIFPEKLIIDKINCRTTKINEALKLILATDKGLGENKTEQLFKKLKLSGDVEVTGVEPVSKHGRRKLSTCLFQY